MKLEGKVSIRQGDGYSGKCYVCECEDLPMIYEMKKEMFWERFWDLWQVSFGNRMPCPGCGMRPAQACGYGHRYWTGEFDCTAPDNEDGEIMCEECHHLYCAKCKEDILREM